MRLYAFAFLAAAACGCACPPPPAAPAASRAATPSDARDGARQVLEARLAKLEAQLERAKDADWDGLARSRLELTLALAMLEREPPGRALDPDALLAAAKARMAELERTRAERTREEEEARHELEKRAASEERRRDERERAELDRIRGALDDAKKGADQQKHKKQKIQTRCSPGDPLCVDAGPAAPPPTGGLEEDDSDKSGGEGGVHAARVLPSSQNPEAGVSRLVEQHATRLAACVPATQRATGMRMEVRVRVDGRGRFREPRVLGADVDPRVGSCIVEVFRGMRLDDGGESRVVTVPLWLPPDR
jgi:hypothetical protein